MLRFDSVSYRYNNGNQALRHIDFNLKQGELSFLTGHSGSGKSTLLKLISGELQPSQGGVFWGPQNILRTTRRSLINWRQRLGIIWQDHRLVPYKSVFDNVAVPLMIQNWSKEDIRVAVQSALERVDLLKYKDQRPDVLSAGEKQRLAIARALVHKPELIVADEPTGLLDPVLAREIMRLFIECVDEGATVFHA